MTPKEHKAYEQKVSEQFKLFEAELPSLIPLHRDKWIVYLDGPKGFFSSEHEALEWSYRNLGVYAGMVIAQVAPQRVVDLRRF
jgi:hypothetical protein